MCDTAETSPGSEQPEAEVILIDPKLVALVLMLQDQNEFDRALAEVNPMGEE